MPEFMDNVNFSESGATALVFCIAVMNNYHKQISSNALNVSNISFIVTKHCIGARHFTKKFDNVFT